MKTKTDKTMSFPNGNCAVMRHADDRRGGITDTSIQVLQRVAKDLREQIGEKEVRIFHSPLRRAMWTAQNLAKFLRQESNTAIIAGPLEWLYCGEEAIARHIDEFEEPEDFVVLISHQPDLEHFLCVRSGVTNCSLFARDFRIKGH
ncbi:MAG: histidine phosphatase family protein [Candidatus Paceibacterota bacterium]